MGRITENLIKNMPSGVLRKIRNISRKIKYNFGKTTPKIPMEKIKFEVHLTDHCNLNCKGCGHFSPLIKEGFAEVESFKKDIIRLSSVFNKQAEHIFLMGGEPLLHPNVSEFLKISREFFPETRLVLITNGLLLNKMNESFWQTCKEYDIEISVTKYPVNIDYDKLKKLADSKSVNLTFFGDFHGTETSFYNISIDFSGKNDREKAFNHCQWANDCVQLSKGRLFTCVTPAYYEFFAEYFGKENLVTKKDSIDIYTNDKEEILTFLSKSIPFCKFCDMGRHEYRKWEQSKKEIGEWTI